MSQKETEKSLRINHILKELKPFIELKVIAARGYTGSGFAAVWDVKIKQPMSIKEVYDLKTIDLMRGFTITLEDGTIIKTRLDIDYPIQIYPPNSDSIPCDGLYILVTKE